ncbi:MAG: hypothetical protein JW682_05330 [Campylobacterales bacterium]|nr:hypothetical protein [Campylobacterales bacterium]
MAKSFSHTRLILYRNNKKGIPHDPAAEGNRKEMYITGSEAGIEKNPVL